MRRRKPRWWSIADAGSKWMKEPVRSGSMAGRRPGAGGGSRATGTARNERQGGDGGTERRTANNPPAASGLRLLLSSDRKTYPVGTPVRFTLTVTNSGRTPLTLQFSSGQKYDIVV